VTLTRSVGSLDDDADFGSFRCWDGDNAKPWVEEVENYVRGALLRQPDMHILAFREAGELAAVAAFYRRIIGLPILDPVDQQAWHLEVVAIRLDRQGQGLSSAVLQQTLEAMRVMDSDCILITGLVHCDNDGAFTACSRVGIKKLVQRDEHYWLVLGELVEKPGT